MNWKSESRQSPEWDALSEQQRGELLGLARKRNCESGNGGLVWSNTFKVGKLTCELSLASDDPVLKMKWWPQAPKSLPLKKEYAKQWMEGRATLLAQIGQDVGNLAVFEV